MPARNAAKNASSRSSVPAVSWLPAADSAADAAELEAWDSVGEAGLPGATCVWPYYLYMGK